MIGIILAGGQGHRLRTYQNVPKILTEVNDTRFLEWILELYIEVNIRPIYIVLGYQSDLVEEAVNNLPQRLSKDVVTICNQEFDTTDTAHAFLLATKQHIADTIVCYGDTLIAPFLFHQIVANEYPNLMTVDSSRKWNEIDMKVDINNGLLRMLGKDLDPTSTSGEYVPLYKLSKNTIQTIIKLFKKKTLKGEKILWVESLLIDVMKDIDIKPLYCKSDDWCEIDKPEDFNQVRDFLATHLNTNEDS